MSAFCSWSRLLAVPRRACWHLVNVLNIRDQKSALHLPPVWRFLLRPLHLAETRPGSIRTSSRVSSQGRDVLCARLALQQNGAVVNTQPLGFTKRREHRRHLICRHKTSKQLIFDELSVTSVTGSTECNTCFKGSGLPGFNTSFK